MKVMALLLLLAACSEAPIVASNNTASGETVVEVNVQDDVLLPPERVEAPPPPPTYEPETRTVQPLRSRERDADAVLRDIIADDERRALERRIDRLEAEKLNRDLAH